MPKHCKVITIEDDVNELNLNGPLFNTIALYGSKFSGITAKNQVINALRMRPDRVIIGEIRGEEAAELFSGANLGTPFMTTMHSSEEELGVIKKLLVKPMSVECRALSMLDMSIHMKQTGMQQRCISSIFEYFWLSRAETETGTAISENDVVRYIKTAESSRIAPEFMDVSKAVARHSNAKGFSKKAARKDFEARVKAIRTAYSSSTDESTFAESILNEWYK